MSYSPAIRQQALARVAAGESKRRVALSLGVHPSQVTRWCLAASDSSPAIDVPVREQIAHDLQVAMLKCAERTLELLPQAESPREAAYATKCLSEVALSWVDPGRRAARGAVSPPPLQFNLFGELPIEERRAALARLIDGADVSHP